MTSHGRVSYCVWSRTGKVRSQNADQFLIASGKGKRVLLREESDSAEPLCALSAVTDQLLLVADGIGSGPGGHHASELVARSMGEFVLEWPAAVAAGQSASADLPGGLERALRDCQQMLETEALTLGMKGGLGTTATAAYICWPTMHLIHAGDSRLYLFREGQLIRLTTDHTMAQKLIDAELVDEAAVRETRWNHVLWNAVTSDVGTLEPQTGSVELQYGDWLMLCTDGLTKHVPEDTLARILDSTLSPRVATERLVRTALAAGGSDNVTVLTARFVSRDERPAQSDAARRSREDDTICAADDQTLHGLDETRSDEHTQDGSEDWTLDASA